MKRALVLLLVLNLLITGLPAAQIAYANPDESVELSVGDGITAASEIVFESDSNILTIGSGVQEVKIELCTPRTVRVQLSTNTEAPNRGYRDDPAEYMVQKTEWPLVAKTISDQGDYTSIKTAEMEIRVTKDPVMVGMYDLSGNLLSKDVGEGMYSDGNLRGVKKEEGTINAGGIFGFGTNSHGRTNELNRYNIDYSSFHMEHGKAVAPFFMSSVGYGIFLNTYPTNSGQNPGSSQMNTTFYKRGGGFQTTNYLDYYFMYGPDFKVILNEYTEITGRQELYGKWAHGFMLSKYGANNATQDEFYQWIERLRGIPLGTIKQVAGEIDLDAIYEDYPKQSGVVVGEIEKEAEKKLDALAGDPEKGWPTDVYAFDFGWRPLASPLGGADPNSSQNKKFGPHQWDTGVQAHGTGAFYDVDEMFGMARALGVRVGLHNNAGTPGSRYSGSADGALWPISGDATRQARIDEWTRLHIDNVIKPQWGDWFWPDEFDVSPAGGRPIYAAIGPATAWKKETVESRPLFVIRGAYGGQNYATTWSGDIAVNIGEMAQQIGYHVTTGLIGFWATSHDLGGFLSPGPNDELYRRWTSQFGSWNAIMRTHGHNGREPWQARFTDETRDNLRENLKIRYALYPYTYSLAWQGYSQSVPIMRAMLLEDNGRLNRDTWNLNRQYYYGDWFMVAPALETKDTDVVVYFPPNTTWYNYYTGLRYEGGPDGLTTTVHATLDEIPVFVKAGAIVPMGPDVQYADEKPLDPLTLDIYPHGNTSFTLYEDDGQSRRYLTENAYSTTTFESFENGKDISFKINAREDNNPAVYLPDARSYNLKFNHIANPVGVRVNERLEILEAETLAAYDASSEAWFYDAADKVLYVKTPDTGLEINVVIDSDGVVQPEEGPTGEPIVRFPVTDGAIFEAENGVVYGNVDQRATEWGGFTGEGYIGGFRDVNSGVRMEINVTEPGVYDLLLRAASGHTIGSERRSTIYLDDVKITGLQFAGRGTWGNTVDGASRGIWDNYVIPDVKLEAGNHVIQIDLDGATTITSSGSGYGRFNIDSLTFNRKVANAFDTIEAESASELGEGAAISGEGLILATGDWARFDDVKGLANRGENAVTFTVRAKSAEGARIVVNETGLADRVLATADVPGGDVWTTVTVDSLDAGRDIANVFLTLISGDDCEIDWFYFDTNADVVSAYSQIDATSAFKSIAFTEKSNSLYGYTSSWAAFKDVNFGRSGPTDLTINYANGGSDVGVMEVRLGSIYGRKIAEFNLQNTGGWTSFKPLETACEGVTGVHDVYVLLRHGDTVTANWMADLSWLLFTDSADERTFAKSISVDETPIPGFTKQGFEYSYELPANTTNPPTISAIADPGVEVSITQATSVPGIATVFIGSGDRAVGYTIMLYCAPAPTGRTAYRPFRVGDHSGLASGVTTPTKTVNNVNGHGYFGGLADGRWIRFSDVDFGPNGARSFDIRYANGVTNVNDAYVEVYQGDPAGDGVKIAEAYLAPTGSWTTFSISRAIVSDDIDTSGIHDVYFRFKRGSSPSSGAADVVWFMFCEKEINAYDQMMVGMQDYGTVTDIANNNGSHPDIALNNARLVDGLPTTYFGGTNDGRWVKYSDVQFGERGAESVTARYSYGDNETQAATKAYVEVWLGNPVSGGVRIAIYEPVPNSGVWDDYRAITVPLTEKVTGLHDVYVMFVRPGIARGAGDIPWIIFNEKEEEAKIPLTGISLDKASMRLAPGGIGQLTPIFTPDDATDKNVIWGSSNENVATVDSSGAVTAVGQGSTRITAWTLDGQLYTVCIVTVRPKFEVLLVEDAKGKLWAEFNVNNTDSEELEVRGMIAIYKNGVLYRADGNMITADGEEFTSKRFAVDVPSGDYTVKAFLWDAMSCVPLCKAAEFK